jgi:hypothetical protein
MINKFMKWVNPVAFWVFFVGCCILSYQRFQNGTYGILKTILFPFLGAVIWASIFTALGNGFMKIIRKFIK